MGLNSIHIEFRKRAAQAFLKVAVNPHAPNHQLTGSYEALRDEFKRSGIGLGTLTRMTKPRSEGGLERLVVKDDGSWSFTASGLNEYKSHLDDARSGWCNNDNASA